VIRHAGNMDFVVHLRVYSPEVVFVQEVVADH
jgi:hypothetical protein